MCSVPSHLFIFDIRTLHIITYLNLDFVRHSTAATKQKNQMHHKIRNMIYSICALYSKYSQVRWYDSPLLKHRVPIVGGVWPRSWVWRSRSHTRTSQHISYLQFVTLLAFILGPLLHYSVLDYCVAIYFFKRLHYLQ